MLNPSVTPTISAMDLRRNPGQLLDRVAYRNEVFVIERAGHPKAVLVSLQDYQMMQQLRQEARERVFDIIDTVREAAQGQDPHEIETIINEELDAYRRERRQNTP